MYDILFFAMIFIGMTFAVLLAFVKSVNRSANRFLALALVAMMLWMLRVLAIDIHPESSMRIQFLMALGPLLYFYVLKITRPQYKFGWSDALHFMPLLLEQAMLTFQGGVPLLQLLLFISMIAYLYKINKLIQGFYCRLPLVLMDRPRLEFRWLQRLLAATGLLFCLWIASAEVDYFVYRDGLGGHAYYPFLFFLQ